MSKVITLAQIAGLTGGSVVGDPEIRISSISDPRKPKEGAISPLWEKKLEKFAAGCPVLFTKKGWVREGQSGVELDDPRVGLIALLHFFDEAPERVREISERAVVDEGASLGENVAVGAGSVIQAGASVGDGTVIMENVFIDCGVTIGKNCVIEPGAVVFHHSVLGDRCVLHANTVVGCDGFGFVPDPKAGMVKIPQIGIAHLDDGGYLIFTTFGRCNMHEVSSATGRSLPYRTADELRKALEAAFEVTYCDESETTVAFDSPLDVLRHLKMTGVTASGTQAWTRRDLAQFCRRYDGGRRTADGRVTLTYHPIYFVTKKK